MATWPLLGFESSFASSISATTASAARICGIRALVLVADCVHVRVRDPGPCASKAFLAYQDKHAGVITGFEITTAIAVACRHM
jgi:hypothetical protein